MTKQIQLLKPIYCFLLVLCLAPEVLPGKIHRSKKGCLICGRKTDKDRPFLDIPNDFEEKQKICSAFHLKEIENGQICSACSRAVRRYTTLGQKAPMVSTVP